MKTALAQINTTPGDFDGNLAQIKEWIAISKLTNVDLLIFPELSIPGYLTADMMYRTGYVNKNLQVLQQVVNLTAGSTMHVVIGYIDRNAKGIGKKFANKAAVISNGTIVATYQKQLLPFYDVFDEGRYFEPGTDLTVVNIKGQKWGICICEDVWNDKGSDDYNYSNNPLQKYREIGIENIISINSSPFVKGKPLARVNMLKNSVKQLIYVNQIGGQDELVFDGNSFHVKDGEVIHYCKERANLGSIPSDWFYDVSEVTKAPQWEYRNLEFVLKEKSNIQDVYEILVLGLKDYVRKTGFKDVVVGSSGGIDSAVVLALACDALGERHVHGIRMPSVYSSKGSVDDALALHDNLGCHDYLVPIDHKADVEKVVKIFKAQKNSLTEKTVNPVAEENWQARQRGKILMHFSNAFGALLLTTGNKTELALGYCTLYGDMNGGFAVINDQYKMMVYELAKYINSKRPVACIPIQIIYKAPSAELAPGQTDEASLLPYPILDEIVKANIEYYVDEFEEFKEWINSNTCNSSVYEWAKQEGCKEQFDRMMRIIEMSEFKRRQAAPGIKTCKVSFGTGRRLPIVKGKR